MTQVSLIIMQVKVVILFATLHSRTSLPSFSLGTFSVGLREWEPQPQIFVCMCKLFSCFDQTHQKIFV